MLTRCHLIGRHEWGAWEAHVGTVRGHATPEMDGPAFTLYVTAHEQRTCARCAHVETRNHRRARGAGEG